MNKKFIFLLSVVIIIALGVYLGLLPFLSSFGFIQSDTPPNSQPLLIPTQTFEGNSIITIIDANETPVSSGSSISYILENDQSANFPPGTLNSIPINSSSPSLPPIDSPPVLVGNAIIESVDTAKMKLGLESKAHIFVRNIGSVPINSERIVITIRKDQNELSPISHEYTELIEQNANRMFLFGFENLPSSLYEPSLHGQYEVIVKLYANNEFADEWTGQMYLSVQLNKPIDFAMDSGILTNCGTTCRQTTATITNTGDSTAHSVCVVLTVFNSKGEQIFLNNEPNIQRCIGDLEGGQSKSEAITINADCGWLYTKCSGKTLTLKCQVKSNEKTVQFPDKVFSG